MPEPPPSTDTTEMQVLLRKIAEQIAEAEQRQGEALDGVRTRLSGLAEQTEAAKAHVPADCQPSLTSLEDRISQMAQTVASKFFFRSSRSLKRTKVTPGISGPNGSRYFAVHVVASDPNVRP